MKCTNKDCKRKFQFLETNFMTRILYPRNDTRKLSVRTIYCYFTDKISFFPDARFVFLNIISH